MDDPGCESCEIVFAQLDHVPTPRLVQIYSIIRKVAVGRNELTQHVIQRHHIYLRNTWEVRNGAILPTEEILDTATELGEYAGSDVPEPLESVIRRFREKERYAHLLPTTQ